MRKLLCSSISFTLAILLCHYVIPTDEMIRFIPLWILGTLFACLIFDKKLRIVILLVSVFFTLGVCRYYIHADKHLGIENDLTDGQYRVTAYVADFPTVSDEYTKVIVHLRTDLLPEVKAVLYDYDNVVSAPKSLQPGNMIRTSVRFVSASRVSGEDTDNYISKGIYLRGYFVDDVTSYETWFAEILYAPKYLANWIRTVLDEFLHENTSVFMKALLTGDKTELYIMPEIYNRLSQAGLAHIVAVSGMHVSFVVAFILILFGNRYGWIASVLMLLIFVVMTGASPSIIRAAFMQALYLLAPVLRRESDGLTSIGFALFVLLIVNPFAIASVSLQLSFSAVLGIVLFTPKILNWFIDKAKGHRGITKKLYYFVASSVATSFGASIFTIPLCAVHFGTISLLAPITNLLVLWIVPCCFVLGFILCAIAPISSVAAQLVGVGITVAVEYIYGIAKCVSDISFSTVYLTGQTLRIWLVIVFVSIAVGLFLKQKILRICVPAVMSFASLMLLCFATTSFYNQGTTVAAIDVGQGQCIVVMHDEYTAMIDCGGSNDSGNIAAKWLLSHGRDCVDAMFVTHFDVDHTNGIENLISQVPVENVYYCTLNLSEYESEQLMLLNDAMERYNVKTHLVNRSAKMFVGEMDVQLYIPQRPKNNDGMMVLLGINGYDVLVTGDTDIDIEEEMMRYVHLPDGECLVAGHHGSKYSTSEVLLDAFKPEAALISCGYNSYGHPTQEVLDRLNDRNVIIYRTDMLGTVELKVR